MLPPHPHQRWGIGVGDGGGWAKVMGLEYGPGAAVSLPCLPDVSDYREEKFTLQSRPQPMCSYCFYSYKMHKVWSRLCDPSGGHER